MLNKTLPPPPALSETGAGAAARGPRGPWSWSCPLPARGVPLTVITTVVTGGGGPPTVTVGLGLAVLVHLVLPGVVVVQLQHGVRGGGGVGERVVREVPAGAGDELVLRLVSRGRGAQLYEVRNGTVLLQLPHPPPSDDDDQQHDDDQGDAGQADGEDVDPGRGGHVGEGEGADRGEFLAQIVLS